MEGERNEELSLWAARALHLVRFISPWSRDIGLIRRLGAESHGVGRPGARPPIRPDVLSRTCHDVHGSRQSRGLGRRAAGTIPATCIARQSRARGRPGRPSGSVRGNQADRTAFAPMENAGPSVILDGTL